MAGEFILGWIRLDSPGLGWIERGTGGRGGGAESSQEAGGRDDEEGAPGSRDAEEEAGGGGEQAGGEDWAVVGKPARLAAGSEPIEARRWSISGGMEEGAAGRMVAGAGGRVAINLSNSGAGEGPRGGGGAKGM
jgi:hypothetical protein